MEYKELKYEVSEGILTLTLNNPDKMNSITASTCRELLHAFEKADNDDEVRVVIVTGSGKAFSAGAALGDNSAEGSYFMERFMGREDDQPHRDEGGIVVLRIYDMKKPVIAAINGAAYGGGLELALQCDFAYASRSARFALSEVSLGIMPGGGGTQTLARLVGENRAKELILAAKPFTAEEALAWGVVNQVCEPGDLMDQVLAIAGRIASFAPLAVRQAKHSIHHGLQMDINTAMQFEIEAYQRMVKSEDRIEGVLAFNEKRKPAFKGR